MQILYHFLAKLPVASWTTTPVAACHWGCGQHPAHKSGETVDLLPFRKETPTIFPLHHEISLSPLNACLCNFYNFEWCLLLYSDLLIIHLFKGIYLLGSNHVPNTAIDPENIILGFAFL